jgi:hypothetical protein
MFSCATACPLASGAHVWNETLHRLQLCRNCLLNSPVPALLCFLPHHAISFSKCTKTSRLRTSEEGVLSPFNDSFKEYHVLYYALERPVTSLGSLINPSPARNNESQPKRRMCLGIRCRLAEVQQQTRYATPCQSSLPARHA